MVQGGGHQPANSSTSVGVGNTYSSTTFHYDQTDDSQQWDQNTSYYDDENGPPQDCACCDTCCGCVSTACESFAVCGPRAGLWAVASFVFWAILWGFAASFPAGQQFYLNVGETWQVPVPLLWSRSTFEIYTTTADPGVEIYSFSPVMEGKPAKCPHPTPETSKKLHDTSSITLHGGEYQYAYYHLNEGSKLGVDIHQSKGSINIYLLQGFGAVKSLEKAEKDDVSSSLDFRGQSILKRFSGQGGETTFTYEVKEPDYFVLVYDNAAAFTTSKLITQIDIDATTHPLVQSRLVCDAKGTSAGGCVWKLTTDMDRRRVGASCIVAKAISSVSHVDPAEIDDTQVVCVHLKAKIGSLPFTCLASIPLLIGIFLLYQGGQQSCRNRRPDGGSRSMSPRTLWKSRDRRNKTNYQSVPVNENSEGPTALQSGHMPTVSERTSSTASPMPSIDVQVEKGSYQHVTN